MTNWYSFKPVDTLFFKGASNANRGDDHTASSIFPPSCFTIEGALRTAVLVQNNIDFKNYGNINFDNKKIIETIGKAGEKSPFQVIGPLFIERAKIFVPVPYTWYMQKKDKKDLQKNDKKEVLVSVIEKIESNLIYPVDEEIFWVKPESKEELVNCGGFWINIKDLKSFEKKKTLYVQGYFVVEESRTGIGMNNKTGIVHEGHLYQFNHMRLRESVSLVFGVDADLPISDKGILKLGAEQRFGQYQKIENPFDKYNSQNSGQFLSLGLIKNRQDNQANDNIIATGKIQYRGGWDLKKGFHKDMEGYFPAGSVFKKNINNNFMKI